MFSGRINHNSRIFLFFYFCPLVRGNVRIISLRESTENISQRLRRLREPYRGLSGQAERAWYADDMDSESDSLRWGSWHRLVCFETPQLLHELHSIIEMCRMDLVEESRTIYGKEDRD